jgi:GTP-sensing pleiotropic transcriptional regulator CodY
MKSKYGQVGYEALIAFGIIFILFIGTYMIYGEKSRDLIISARELEERADCLKVANAYTSIFTLGKESQMNITIYHNLTVFPSEQRIETENFFCTFVVPVVYYNGSRTNDTFTLIPGELRIINEGT